MRFHSSVVGRSFSLSLSAWPEERTAGATSRDSFSPSIRSFLEGLCLELTKAWAARGLLVLSLRYGGPHFPSFALRCSTHWLTLFRPALSLSWRRVFMFGMTYSSGHWIPSPGLLHTARFPHLLALG